MDLKEERKDMVEKNGNGGGKQGQAKRKIHLFLNRDQYSWNASIDMQCAQICRKMDEADINTEFHLCMFLPEIVNLRSS